MKLLHGGYVCWKCGKYIPDDDVIFEKGYIRVPYGECGALLPDDSIRCPYCGCSDLYENESAWRGKVRAKFSELLRLGLKKNLEELPLFGDSVLLNIHPKECELIKNAERLVEVRPTKPEIPTPFKVYIYEERKTYVVLPLHAAWYEKEYKSGTGRVIGEFICDSIITDTDKDHYELFNMALTSRFNADIWSRNKEVYGWNISDLKIYEVPRPLSDFGRICKPPKSWCYVEELKGDEER